MAANRLTVAIYAQLTPEQAGGIAQAVLQLVTQLGRLDGPENYVIITSPEGARWLRPHIGPNQSLRTVEEHLSHTGPAWERRFAALIKRRANRLVPALERLWRGTVLPLRAWLPGMLAAPRSDGFIESLGADVVHFPYQRFIQTALPCIFEPWDLQHQHLPEFFTFGERHARDKLYRAGCRQASVVAVASDWVRNDLVEQYGIATSKFALVRRGPGATTAGPRPSVAAETSIRKRFGLPQDFILYPAQTWPHKNHVRLLETLALLRDANKIRVHLVCTGGINDYFSVIQAHVRLLRLEDQVTFTRYIPQSDLAELYQLAKFLIFPSLFEGYGFPVIEALAYGLPVACANVASLPEIAGEAAYLFDPRSIESIAEAVLELWRCPATRDDLVARGRARLKLFDSAIGARTFRALYRELGNRALTPEDHHLLHLARTRTEPHVG